MIDNLQAGVGRWRAASLLAGLFVVVLCSRGMAGVDRAEPWQTWHGNPALTGVGAVAFPDQPELRWRTRVGTRLGSPIVGGAGLLVCLADGTLVTALDVAGKVQWTRRFDSARAVPKGMPPRDERFEAPPLYVDGSLLVVASTEGRVYGLSPEDGHTLWMTKLSGPIQGTPNVAVVGADDGQSLRRILIMLQDTGVLVALDARSGAVVWESEPMDRTDGHVAVSDGRVVFGNCASAFFALSVETGKALMAPIAVGEECEMAGGVAIRGALACGGNRSGSLVCVDLDRQAVRWVNPAGEGELFTTPAIHDAMVVFCGDDAVVRVAELATGRQVWAFETMGSQAESPVVAGGDVVVAVDGTLLGLAMADGAQQWRIEVGDAITPPALVGELLVVGSDDGQVLAYGPRSAD